MGDLFDLINSDIQALIDIYFDNSDMIESTPDNIIVFPEVDYEDKVKN